MKKKETDSNDVCVKVSLLLDKFFGEVKHSFDWAKSRRGRPGVIISYTDFMIEPLLKNMLRDIIPDEVHFVLKREYSDAAIAKALLEEYKKNRIAVVDCYGGSLTTEPVRAFVNRKLSVVEML